MFELEVLNPVAVGRGELRKSPLASRPRTLEGKTVGLLANGKRGAAVAVAKAGELIQARFPDVKVIQYQGADPCPSALIERAKAECDVIVGSTGD
ncbi:MAG: hypothetical protein HYX92_01170 [Chloroflexi bacterium]|nr:hypothetical protein [Chloroflexota bacterium]